MAQQTDDESLAALRTCEEYSELPQNDAWVEEAIAPVFTSEEEIRPRQNHYEKFFACLSTKEQLQSPREGSRSRTLSAANLLAEWFVLFTGTAENSVLPTLRVLDPIERDLLRQSLNNPRELVNLETSSDAAVKRLREARLPPPRGFVYVRFFSDRDHLPSSLRAAFGDETTAAVTLPGGRYVAILKDAEPKALSHELVHAYINARFPATTRALPRWFQEGTAIYFSGSGHPDPEVLASGTIKRIEATEEYAKFGLAFEYLENQIGDALLGNAIRDAVEKQDANILLGYVSAATEEDLFAKATRWHQIRLLEQVAITVFLVIVVVWGSYLWFSRTPVPASTPQVPDANPAPYPGQHEPSPVIGLSPAGLIKYFHSIVGHQHEPTAEELHEAQRLLDTYGENGAMHIVENVVRLWHVHGLEPQSFNQLDVIFRQLLPPEETNTESAEEEARRRDGE